MSDGHVAKDPTQLHIQYIWPCRVIYSMYAKRLEAKDDDMWCNAHLADVSTGNENMYDIVLNLVIQKCTLLIHT